MNVKASSAMTEDCRCFLTGVLIRCVRNFQIRWEGQTERAWYIILSLITQREAHGCSQEDSLSSQYSPAQLRDLKGSVNNGLSSMTNVNPGNVCPPLSASFSILHPMSKILRMLCCPHYPGTQYVCLQNAKITRMGHYVWF